MLNPIRWWVAGLVAIAASVVATILTPTAIREISEERLLQVDGVETTGQIVKHRKSTSRGCQWFSTVLYRVESVPHFVSLKGCGAAPDVLPVGSVAQVTYARSSPAIAKAWVLNAETSRFNPIALVLMWLISPVFFAFAWYLWRKKHPQGIVQNTH